INLTARTRFSRERATGVLRADAVGDIRLDRRTRARVEPPALVDSVDTALLEVLAIGCVDRTRRDDVDELHGAAIVGERDPDLAPQVRERRQAAHAAIDSGAETAGSGEPRVIPRGGGRRCPVVGGGHRGPVTDALVVVLEPRTVLVERGQLGALEAGG